MAALRHENARSLAEHLFASPERWGWHYVEPGPAQESSELANEPGWFAPHPPNFKVRQRFQAQLKANGGLRVGVLSGLLLWGVLLINISGGAPLLLLGVVLGAIWFASPTLAALRMGLARSRFERYLQDQWSQYSAAHEAWSERVQEWDASAGVG